MKRRKEDDADCPGLRLLAQALGYSAFRYELKTDVLLLWEKGGAAVSRLERFSERGGFLPKESVAGFLKIAERLSPDSPCCVTELLLAPKGEPQVYRLSSEGLFDVRGAATGFFGTMQAIRCGGDPQPDCCGTASWQMEELRAQNEEYATVVRQSNKCVLRYDPVTRRCVCLCGPSGGFPLQKSWENVPEAMLCAGAVEAGSIAAFRSFFKAIDHGEPTGSCDVRLRNDRGSCCWHHFDYTMMPGAQGKPAYALLSVYENSEAVERELAYRKWLDRMESFSKESYFARINLTTGIIERESDPLGLEKGRPADTLFSYVDFTAGSVVCPEDREAFCKFFDCERLLQLVSKKTQTDTLEYRCLSGGQPLWLCAELQLVRHPVSGDVILFLNCRSIDESRREKERLEKAAATDAMTKLLNHEATFKQIQTELCGDRGGCALFMIDLDDFKQINDTCGHQKGDEVLICAAKAIRSVFRQDDIVGRVGGDEFLALMAGGVTEQTALCKAQELQRALQNPASGCALTASIGIALSQGGPLSCGELYALADEAIYKAKRAGKNRCCVLCAKGEETPSEKTNR